MSETESRQYTKNPQTYFLCLKCRSIGHLVKDCPHPWPTNFPDHSWTYSPERKELIGQLMHTVGDKLCTRCVRLDILSMFEGDLQWTTPKPSLHISSLAGCQHYRNLGPVGDVIFSRDCPLCVCLFGCASSPESMTQEVHLIADWTIHRFERLVQIASDKRHQYDKCIKIDLIKHDGTLPLDEHEGDALGLLRDPSDALSLSPRLVHPQKLDIEAVRGYLFACERLHALTCEPKKSSELRGISLIDIEDRKTVVLQDLSQEYLTLSYVWGGLKPGLYQTGQALPNLPRTIEDAMSLCLLLGRRYLWVDLICIDQTDEFAKVEQIRKMSAIYSGAYACIVSLCGSSMDDGLARVQGSRRAAQPQLSCSIGDTHLVGLMPTLSQQTHNTTWGKRSWTLQEALLSPRCVYVSDHQVYVECNAMQCSESLDENKSWIHRSQREYDDIKRNVNGHIFGHGTLRNTLISDHIPENYMSVYGVLVNLYSERYMTKSSDALFAFSGILQHLTYFAHKNGFFQGLPIAELNWSLLWVPYPPIRRRSGFPSWSWTGWEAIVHPGWPASIETPHRFWTHFYAWKVESGELKLIHPLRRQPDPENEEARLFRESTIFDTISEQRAPAYFDLQQNPMAEEDSYLFIDCALCSLSFFIGSNFNRLDYGPYRHIQIKMNEIPCFLRVDLAASSHMEAAFRGQISKKEVILIARERFRNLIYHHFLELEYDDSGRGKRKGVFAVMVPVDYVNAVKGIQVTRQKVILV